MTDTDLEDRLTGMFERRAATVKTVRQIQFDGFDERRTGPSPVPFAVAASVVAVLVAVGGTVVGIRAAHHDAKPLGNNRSTAVISTPPTPTATATVCFVTMPQSWQRAITAGQIPLDHPINNVISVNAGTGDYLVEQVRPATAGGSSQVTLAVFHGRTGEDVTQLPGDTEPLADGGGAVTTDWIGYGLHRQGSDNSYRAAMLYNRHSHQSIVLDDLTSDGGQLNSPPILYGGKAYWLEAFYAEHRGLVKSYDLASGTRTSTPITAAVGLVYYGSGLAVITQSDQGNTLTNYAGTALAPAAIQATVDATYFNYDGSTLRWWNYADNLTQPALYANRPGSAQVSRLVIPGYSMTGPATWPLVEQTSSPLAPIFDSRTNVRVTGPDGLTVQAVIGDQVLIGTGATDPISNHGLSLVSLKDLPPVHC
jgi:hypothetical protein